MISPQNIKTFKIVYNIVSPTGIAGVSPKHMQINAINTESAIEVLRSIVAKDEGCTIRINKIEIQSAVGELNKKKKKKISVLRWIARGIVGVIMLAIFATKFYSNYIN